MTARPVPVFDGHNDVLLRLYRRKDAAAAFLDGDGKGQLDLPRAKQGGFAGGLFAIFVPAPQRKRVDGEVPPPPDAVGAARGETADTPPLDIATALEATLAMASLLFGIERQSGGRVRVCRSVADIEQCVDQGILAPVLHIEGAEAIDGDFHALEVLHQAGLRSLGPVWSRSNAFGHGVPFSFPSSPDTGPGLTDLGKELIRGCNRLKIMIDLSHLNEKGFWDVAAISDAPLVASHSNAHAICPHSRNLTDKQLAAIRETGGMVGVNYAVTFLRPDGKRDSDTPLSQVVDHIDYLIRHLGEDGVGLGSDFDGAAIPKGIGTAAGLPNLVEEMRARQYGEALIEKVCFRNWLRVLKTTWS
ncbi:dipeptidase [Bradyrhizobium sp. LHD-71]|uniref:dipeptidase n=1 Tax=Bradyrhizobium sp. LHD-71 TaxID=3072141 RepID=UPI00280DC371|nr:dipeptidase [Bradyrhizobium sp. LHD-71]MDQ8729087.1 dipeptidase [Bradyrhizobium sp. LHD-71]